MAACHHIRVPREACILQFSDGRIFHSERVGINARGDELWAHCDADGRVIEIELLGDKPCQRKDERARWQR